YQEHAKHLWTTGEGVKSPGEEETSDEFFDCYIPASGPDWTMTAEARSIWDEIIEVFPFFPVLHHIFSSCPNVTPIILVTGVGPHGKKTIHVQP
ncbi:hypothetical protein M404DRAFT_117570, partial [Pisolithus tinctorius Marx 270]